MSKSPERSIQVYCGELCKSLKCNPEVINLVNYNVNGLEPNVTVGYENFVYDPNTLSDRILDLLQIAAMVFCADRMARRSERDSVSNQGWSRSFEFHISVLDFDFWNNDTVKTALTDALLFMTGDRVYSFNFVKADKGHFEEKKYYQISLFQNEMYGITGIDDYDVILFSGGLDSLAGVLEEIAENHRKVIAVSHKSNTGVVHVQKQLIEKLNKDYNNSILPYGFSCHNKGVPSYEETQRTRMFLFSAIAFAICQCFNKHKFYVYENGITSLNFPIQTDVFNARASRTTHPKTLGLLRRLYKLFDASFDIVVPYYKKTKEEVIKVFKRYDRLDLMASAVSCSSTRTKRGLSPHCGCCSQCIDRRFAMFAAGLYKEDGTYAEDFIHEMRDSETSQRLYQQMRFASAIDYSTVFEMVKHFPSETQDAAQYWPCENPDDSLNEIHELLMRYSDSALRAAKNMLVEYDDLRSPINENSFLKIIANREYLKTPFERRVEKIDKKIQQSFPIMFSTEKPKNENDLNNKIVGILNSADERWIREYPVIEFGITNYRADSSFDRLIIETKYIRGDTSPSKITDGIAADIIKIPAEQNVFFIIYDPERQIKDDEGFCLSFMNRKNNCFVKVYR